MSFSIVYSNEQSLSYSPSSNKDIGKRVIIIGTCDTFDSTGYVDDEANVPSGSTYDYRSVEISSLNSMKSVYGDSNGLYYSYQSFANGGAIKASIVKIPYTRTVASDTTVTDREQFKLNLISAIQTILERDEFDICVLSGVCIKDDNEAIKTIVSNMTNKNLFKLVLVNASLDNSSHTLDSTIPSKLNSILGLKSDMLRNICVVQNNAYYDSAKSSITVSNVDYDNFDYAAYTAGIVTSSNYKHPAMVKTIFNSVATGGVDDRTTYFRNNSIKGIILSNFQTLGSSIDSKNAISSAINVYRTSVVISTLNECLKPLIGTPIYTDSKYGSLLQTQETIKTILDSFVSMEIINKYKFSFDIDQIKMTLAINLELVMYYDLEKVIVSSTVGV